MTTAIVVTFLGFAILAMLEPTPRQVAAAERAKRTGRTPGRLFT